MLPVHDVNPTRRAPWVTRLLLLANIVVFVLSPIALSPVLGESAPAALCRQVAFLDEFAAKPAEVVSNDPVDVVATREVVSVTEEGVECGARSGNDKVPFLSVLSAMFLHGGWLHLLGNLLFLYVFGNNVEDRLGKLRYLAFYLGCGYAATYGFSLFFSGSEQPLVGASGAIAGVLGAYLVLFPKARIWSLLTFFFFLPVRLPAWLVLGSWFVLQYFYAQGAGLAGETQTAYLAHVIGFVVGAALVWKLRRTATPRPIADPRWGPYSHR